MKKHVEKEFIKNNDQVSSYRNTLVTIDAVLVQRAFDLFMTLLNVAPIPKGPYIWKNKNKK